MLLFACKGESTRENRGTRISPPVASAVQRPRILPRVAGYAGLVGKTKRDVVSAFGPPARTAYGHVAGEVLFEYGPRGSGEQVAVGANGADGPVGAVEFPVSDAAVIDVLHSMSATHPPNGMGLNKSVLTIQASHGQNESTHVRFHGVTDSGFPYLIRAACAPVYQFGRTFNYETNSTEIGLAPNPAFDWKKCRATSVRLSRDSDGHFSDAHYASYVDSVSLNGAAGTGGG